MNDQQKKAQLRKYKAFATGLFLLMAVIFVAMTVLEKQNPARWIGYIRAFSEAAMVGALADWFAVTALFNYPLGLKIPHTNLIENSKERIGDNLGNFVVSNFLSPENIRPYIEKIKLSHFLAEWLQQPKNQDSLLRETSVILLDILNKLEDRSVVKFIAKKAEDMTANLKVNEILGNGLDYILEKNDHQRLITNLSAQIKSYISQHREIVRERVKRESFSLIPKFVDDTIADKITSGLTGFFDEVEKEENHDLRREITARILDFSQELKTSEKWQKELQSVKENFLSEQKLQDYAADIWISVKKSLQKELSEENSPLKNYIKKNLDELAANLHTDEKLKSKIDVWVRTTAYKYVLKNTHRFGDLISSTVGNWEGRELSQKLELEVGKDLQFIRVNGTLVGGLVGLLIYTVTEFLLR